MNRTIVRTDGDGNDVRIEWNSEAHVKLRGQLAERWFTSHTEVDRVLLLWRKTNAVSSGSDYFYVE